MKLIVCDTSVLIASFISSHPKHSIALPWLIKAKKGAFELGVSSHSLAECYAILTSIPVTPKISPIQALHIIHENIEKTAKILPLNTADYIAIIKEIAEHGFSGGIIYDAITFKAAQKYKATKLLTLNTKDFVRLCPEQTSFIISP